MCVCSVDEGPVFAMCMTGQGDQATLNRWISGLQENNPVLGQVPTLFRLDSGPLEVQKAADTESRHSHQPHAETQRDFPKSGEEVEIIEEEEPKRSHGLKQ